MTAAAAGAAEIVIMATPHNIKLSNYQEILTQHQQDTLTLCHASVYVKSNSIEERGGKQRAMLCQTTHMDSQHHMSTVHQHVLTPAYIAGLSPCKAVLSASYLVVSGGVITKLQLAILLLDPVLHIQQRCEVCTALQSRTSHQQVVDVQPVLLCQAAADFKLSPNGPPLPLLELERPCPLAPELPLGFSRSSPTIAFRCRLRRWSRQVRMSCIALMGAVAEGDSRPVDSCEEMEAMSAPSGWFWAMSARMCGSMSSASWPCARSCGCTWPVWAP